MFFLLLIKTSSLISWLIKHEYNKPFTKSFAFIPLSVGSQKEVSCENGELNVFMVECANVDRCIWSWNSEQIRYGNFPNLKNKF